MACDSFVNCTNDPLKDNNLSASGSFESLGSTAIFSINLTLYICYIALLIGVVLSLVKGVYAIIGADSADSFEKFRGAVTNAVFAALGIVLIFSARFIFVAALKLIGVPDAENIFMDGPLNQLFHP